MMKKLKYVVLAVLVLAVLLLSSCDGLKLDKDSITEDTPIFAAERWTMAGIVTFEGMLIVFAALGLLFIITSLFGLIFGKRNKNAAEGKEQTKTEAPITAPEAEAAEGDTDDTELTAIITAAVAAYIDGDEELSQEFESGFRVVSFRRTGRK